MTKEQFYKEQLEQIGIYREAFDQEIKTLAMMERELQRMVKRWKNAGSPVKTDLHDAIVQQRRDVLAHRDALGLTPKGLHRLKKTIGDEREKKAGSNVLQLIQDRRQKEA